MKKFFFVFYNILIQNKEKNSNQDKKNDTTVVENNKKEIKFNNFFLKSNGKLFNIIDIFKKIKENNKGTPILFHPEENFYKNKDNTPSESIMSINVIDMIFPNIFQKFHVISTVILFKSNLIIDRNMLVLILLVIFIGFLDRSFLSNEGKFSKEDHKLYQDMVKDIELISDQNENKEILEQRVKKSLIVLLRVLINNLIFVDKNGKLIEIKDILLSNDICSVIVDMFINYHITKNTVKFIGLIFPSITNEQMMETVQQYSSNSQKKKINNKNNKKKEDKNKKEKKNKKTFLEEDTDLN